MKNMSLKNMISVTYCHTGLVCSPGGNIADQKVQDVLHSHGINTELRFFSFFQISAVYILLYKLYPRNSKLHVVIVSKNRFQNFTFFPPNFSSLENFYCCDVPIARAKCLISKFSLFSCEFKHTRFS
uniref:Uncharacterized protein n=1 Tax=Cacopsylla melanoneura TaxID=428564 RepID=A0A8D8T4C1_9HEMI